MPDYGTISGSGTGASSTYGGGSGYVSGSGGSGSKKKQTIAQKNREKKRKAALAAQLKAQQEAYKRQQEIDAAKAISSLGMTGAAQAAEKFPTDRGFGGATQVGYSSSQAKDRTPVNKSAFEKIKDDFLMDIGVKNKDADYYRRLGDRSDAAKKEQERLKEKRDRDRDRARSTPPPRRDPEVDPRPELPPPPVVTPPVLPPPIRPTFPDPYGGLAAFGYSPASMQYESQQGAGQVPYYMAAARNQFNPNLSPAFQYAAQNYDILGGMQRTMPRPIEMMSARERAEIMNMGSNFNVPNYNSPYYQPSPQSQFDFFSNMVGRGGGKGMGRPMSQPMARAMTGGLGSFFGGFT